MATEVRWRRGTAAQHEAFTGAMSEITHDTTNNNIRVHDGETAGGHATLMEREKGVANGLATLDEHGAVPVEQLTNVPRPNEFATKAHVEMAVIVATVEYLRTNGDLEPGDGKGALYKRASSEPSHASKIQSADGAWWEECPQRSSLSFTDLLQDTSSLYAYGANNGWFLGYDLKGGMSFKVYQSENVMDTGGPGAFRDGFYVQHVDGDTTDYGTPQRRVISNGARVLANGKYTNSGGWESQTKDIVALDAHAIGRITGWDDRGVSGIAAGAIQYGSGIASNEFAAENSVYANEQSTSMAAVQAILRPHKGAADATHKYRAVLASNTQGYEATAAFEAYSAAHPTDPARNGAFKIGLELGGVNATEAGIRMPRTGLNGGLIDYDANDYSRYDRTANRFDFVIGGSFVLSWTSFGVAIGGLASGDARLKIPQSTSAGPHIRLVPGGTPSAPQDGDIWFDGQLRIRIGGVTKTFQLV
ncbi:hypothetical protein L3V16_06260 [Brucella ciceri]|uniref:hyaluronate lyase N-terminal domain-containing protein n=1 Tax=Brucella ciceri TaxID=391287 RepID=UPI001F134F39|nr:hypothetical protein [Brucella ciceri]MCH6203443.1 hypothetical protein [Brucella ciceri]